VPEQELIIHEVLSPDLQAVISVVYLVDGKDIAFAEGAYRKNT